MSVVATPAAGSRSVSDRLSLPGAVQNVAWSSEAGEGNDGCMPGMGVGRMPDGGHISRGTNM